MKLFKCQACGVPVYFENRVCTACGHALGFVPQAGEMAALEPKGANFTALLPKKPTLRYCENAKQDACNWLIPVESREKFCLACRHNRTIPDLSVPANLEHWRKMEIAKHRLFYTLLALRLPLPNLVDDPKHGLAFDFLADHPASTVKILTGHDDGLITINLNEADDAEREKLRTAMGEPYRTLLGHFRHEVGHFFWDVLVRDTGRLEACRAVFGDERADYGEALKTHYANGVPADWQQNFISAYATCHPWEDFAETFAHYLHIVDTLETASAFGLRIHPATKNRALHAEINFNPHKAANAAELMDAWLPLTFAMNSLNRSMGMGDLYPFIVSPPVVKKLQYIHDIIHAGPAKTPRRGLFGRRMAVAPEQPPAQPPSPPLPPPHTPPIAPPDEKPPVELPPDHPAEYPPMPPSAPPEPLRV